MVRTRQRQLLLLEISEQVVLGLYFGGQTLDLPLHLLDKVLSLTTLGVLSARLNLVFAERGVELVSLALYVVLFLQLGLQLILLCA